MTPMDDEPSLISPPMPDLDALKAVDRTDPGRLGPALAALKEGAADRFDPVRFRYIEALARKAQKQRPSVARLVEKKVLQLLSGYLDAYTPARERAASLVARVASGAPDAAGEIGRLFAAGDFGGVERLAARNGGSGKRGQGPLAALTREMRQRGGPGGFAPKPSFEDELRRQELKVMQSVAGIESGGAGVEPVRGVAGELSAMRYVRESLGRRNEEKRVARALRDGPENPGPLNSQALVIRSLALMRDLSPGYTSRFVAYMDTLLWLEQAGRAAAPAKPKGAGRRKS